MLALLLSTVYQPQKKQCSVLHLTAPHTNTNIYYVPTKKNRIIKYLKHVKMLKLIKKNLVDVKNSTMIVLALPPLVYFSRLKFGISSLCQVEIKKVELKANIRIRATDGFRVYI